MSYAQDDAARLDILRSGLERGTAGAAARGIR
jgi:hypothetical protein